MGLAKYNCVIIIDSLDFEDTQIAFSFETHLRIVQHINAKYNRNYKLRNIIIKCNNTLF